MTADELPPVLCLDCERPVTNPAARARRVGSKCWRRRRAEARLRLTTVVLPDLTDGRDE